MYETYILFQPAPDGMEPSNAMGRGAATQNCTAKHRYTGICYIFRTGSSMGADPECRCGSI